MNQEDAIVVFKEKTIRRSWYQNAWWFSVVDVCAVLTDSADANAYWRKLKQRLTAESNQPVTFCHGLKLPAPDGKRAALLVIEMQNVFRNDLNLDLAIFYK